MLNIFTKKTSVYTLLALMFLPRLTLAAPPTTYEEFINLILDMINLIIPTLFGALFAYFVWKMIDSWVINADDPLKREAGNKFAKAAVIAFVLMISAWGIVAMLKASFFG